MDYATATDIYVAIRATTLTDLFDDLLEVAIRYAETRVQWLQSPEKRSQIETDRTACHESLIAACDILSRNMAKKGEDNSWRRTLGDDRKRIGDFACFVHCILGISAR